MHSLHVKRPLDNAAFVWFVMRGSTEQIEKASNPASAFFFCQVLSYSI